MYFRGRKVGDFRIDLAVDGRVALELKCCRAIEAVHKAQLVNYLAATRYEVGLLLNFGPKPEVCRMVMTNDRKAQAGRG